MTTSTAQKARHQDVTVSDFGQENGRRETVPHAKQPTTIRLVLAANDAGAMPASMQPQPAQVATSGRSVFTVVAAGFAWLRRALATEMQRRDALHRLRSLDDQTLRDIGLTRSELSYAVRNGIPNRDR